MQNKKSIPKHDFYQFSMKKTYFFCLQFMQFFSNIFSNIIPWHSEINKNPNIIKYETVNHVPKCMSCHKTTVVITRRAHCFHDNIYITLILLLWDLTTLCAVDHLWPLIYIYIYNCNSKKAISTNCLNVDDPLL